MPDFFGAINIRACVLSSDYRYAVTWEWDGAVWLVDRSTGAARRFRVAIRAQVNFNRLLRKLKIPPLRTRDELRRMKELKALEKQMYETDAIIVM